MIGFLRFLELALFEKNLSHAVSPLIEIINGKEKKRHMKKDENQTIIRFLSKKLLLNAM